MFSNFRFLVRKSMDPLKQNDRTKKTKAILVGAIVLIVLAIIAVVITIIVIAVKQKQRAALAFAHAPILMDEKAKKKLNEKFESRKDLNNPTIFVAISSYRDPELCFTIRDLYEKAYNPNRVYVGIVEQNDTKDQASCHIHTLLNKQFNYTKNVAVITMNYKEAKGPTHARSICEGLYKGQEYYLMTDSHMRFEPGWDSELIEMLFKTRRPKRTVITMYPEGYERYEDSEGNVNTRIMMRRGWRYEQIKKFNEQGIVEFESITSLTPPPKKPQYVPMYGACFVFGHCDILKLVPFNPNTPYLFFGNRVYAINIMFR